jgi:putative radical SAM enzyme (TIGR03279 family)
MHGQIVVCPGLNDGVHLQKTVRDLSKLHPALRTVALVPVGLTRYRQGLPALKGITPADAADIVKYYSGLQAEFKKNLGTPFVYLADEFYLLSGFPIPSDEHYGNYEQVENGVGLGRLFLNELEQWRKTPAPSLPGEIQISLVTAQSGSPFLKLFLAELEKIRGIKANLHVLTNEFWGGNVTVTGLLTGSDLLSGLAQKELGQVVFIPAVMLREGTDLFLDDISLRELASKLEVQIVPVNHLSEIRSYLIGHPQRA